MTLANPLPWWALVGILVLAAGLAWTAYGRAPLDPGRRLILGSLRFVTLLLLVILVMRPVIRTSPDGAAEAIVPILVDSSRSMGIEDAGGARRIDQARTLIESELLPVLGPRFRTEVLAFGDELTPVQPAALGATARRSDLTAALERVRERYRGRPLAGIVILSDGGDTSPVAGESPLEIGVPVFPIGVGSPEIGRDREILAVTAAEAVLDDSRIDLAVSAVSHGYERSPIELRLLENGRPVEVRRAVPAADGIPISEVFHVTPPRGAPTVYTVETPAVPGELVPENNSRSALVQPPARARRVLLVQGAPGFEHSFLWRTLTGDRGLEIDSVVRKGRNEQGSDTFYVQAAGARSAALATGYPGRLEDLFAYDAVVLANLEGSALTGTQLEATKAFVGRRGGGLLVLGAQAFLRQGLSDTPLEELLPLDLSERGRGVLQASAQPLRGANRVSLTAAGETHPIMQLAPALDETRRRWDAVPALASIVPLGGPRPGATVLAVAAGPGGAPRALVAVQRYGEGRSMVFTGEAAWRWRMMLPATDRSYDTFWRQAVRWLAAPAGDPVSVTAPSGTAPGDVVPLQVLARTPTFEPLGDATVDVRVIGPDGRSASVPAAPEGPRDSSGAYRARFQAGDAGVYRVTAEVRRPGAEAVTASAAVLVGGADQEMADPRLNLRVLQRLASRSGGRLVQAGEAENLAAQLRAALPASALLVRRDLWHNAWSFAAIVGLLTSEWVLRRRWGLR